MGLGEVAEMGWILLLFGSIMLSICCGPAGQLGQFVGAGVLASFLTPKCVAQSTGLNFFQQ
eukprot:1962811-Pyramimonas_sp.AAC.1